MDAPSSSRTRSKSPLSPSRASSAPPAVATLAAFIAVLNVARSGARAPPRSLVTDARFASANADGATVRRSRRAWNASAGCAPRAGFGFLFVTADAWPLRGFGCTSADVSAAA